MKLVIHPAVDAERLQRIEAAANGMEVVNAASAEEAEREIRDAEAFFGKLTPNMLEQAQALSWVQSPTASLEHFLFPALVEHPCTLTNMRGLFSDVIADHVFAYILAFARNLHLYLRQQFAATWEPIGGDAMQSFATGPGCVSPRDRAHCHVSDCTLGIVGLGSIGSEVARRGAAFGMRIIAVDPDRTDCPEMVASLRGVDGLADLLSASDFVVIAAPHTPETAGMFQRQQFAQMKTTAYLINIGRGAIVKTDDLVEALQDKQLAGAGLDVFEEEPLPASHPLWQMPNVMITPHVAACSVRIAERHLGVLLENVRRFAHGQPLKNVADKRRWY